MRKGHRWAVRESQDHDVASDCATTRFAGIGRAELLQPFRGRGRVLLGPAFRPAYAAGESLFIQIPSQISRGVKGEVRHEPGKIREDRFRPFFYWMVISLIFDTTTPRLHPDIDPSESVQGVTEEPTFGKDPLHVCSFARPQTAPDILELRKDVGRQLISRWSSIQRDVEPGDRQGKDAKKRQPGSREESADHQQENDARICVGKGVCDQIAMRAR